MAVGSEVDGQEAPGQRQGVVRCSCTWRGSAAAGGKVCSSVRSSGRSLLTAWRSSEPLKPWALPRRAVSPPRTVLPHAEQEHWARVCSFCVKHVAETERGRSRCMERLGIFGLKTSKIEL